MSALILINELLSLSNADKVTWLIYSMIYTTMLSLFILGLFSTVILTNGVPNGSKRIYDMFKECLEFIVISVLGFSTALIILSIISAII